MRTVIARLVGAAATFLWVGIAVATEFPLTASTEAGRYRVSLAPVDGSPPIAEFHNWVVNLETADGETFVPTRLGITGGMPAHGHGLVSEPRVTRLVDDGGFLIEGMKFHMGGDWRLHVGVGGPTGFDVARFEFVVAANPEKVDASIRNWSAGEIAVLQSLSLARLPAPSDQSNRFSGNADAAALGHKLFLDKALSATGTIACASCHQPELKFTDGLARSVGTAETERNAPTLIGTAQGSWFYWDGRRDSLWAQAITPIETPGEMDNTRVNVVTYVGKNYGDEYAALTGQRIDIDPERIPNDAGPFASAAGRAAWNGMSAADREFINRAFSNIGKILAAYMETLQPAPSRFDAFVAALSTEGYPVAADLLDEREQAGLKLFLDGSRTQCLRCHNGPQFTNHSFHNIATSVSEDGIPDFGRMIGLQAAMIDEFNCLGNYSDAARDECVELRFADRSHAPRGAFKVPGLRNVAQTGPYMHDGRFETLEQVIEFYTEVPDPSAGPHELPPVELTDEDITNLVAFLGALSGEASD